MSGERSSIFWVFDMNERELWNYFVEHALVHTHPFDRDFIWIAQADFQPIKQYFLKEFNPFHAEKSFRSRGYFRHIHILDQGEYIFAHKDIGNFLRFFPLGLFHLMLDFLPYVIIACVKRKSFDAIFARPQN